MNWETYLALGDSITIGARSYLGYPEWVGNGLEKALDKQWNVVNHAVSGYKAIDLARYIDLHGAHLERHRASISTILIGTNDIKEGVPLAQYAIALNQVIIKAKLLTTNQNVVLLAVPHFHPGVMYPYHIGMNARVEEYNREIARQAQHHGLRMLTFSHEAGHFYDGVHLNADGTTHFAEQLLQFILRDKGLAHG